MTILVHYEDILVPPDRQRQEFDARYLIDLEQSIRETGLLHPLTVELQGDTWTLRAGECRLRAIKKLYESGGEFQHGTELCKDGLVPVVEWSQLTEFQRIAIEVEENIRRRDFNWKERERAIAKYHELRQEQNPQQTMLDTAREINRREVDGGHAAQVSDAIVLVKHLDDPDVAKAKSPKEAMRVVRKKMELIHQAQLARKFDLGKVPHKLIKGDALAALSAMQAEIFDVVLTDPPYGIDADDFGSQSATGHEYNDSRKRWEHVMSVFPEESFRVAKARAHAYVFCDPRMFSRLEVLMCLAGWRVFSTPLVWFKGNGMVPFPKHGPRRAYETILYAWKGDRETLAVRNDCIIRIPSIRELKHAAQKPVALYCDLLGRSARPGDTVLDAFGGAGGILVASNIMKLTATYIEEQDAPFNIAVSRAAVMEIDDGAEEDDGIRIDLE